MKFYENQRHNKLTGTHIAILVGAAIFFIGAITTLLLIFFDEGDRSAPFGVVYGGLLYFLNGAAFQHGFWQYTVPFSIAVILIWAVLSFKGVRDWLEAKFSAIGPTVSDGTDWLTDKLEERRNYRQAVKRANAKTAPQNIEKKQPPRNLSDDIFD